eukprot:CAMPEP_0172550474 /NCGR_PEP_ID=MMETSP1067-20121228/29992_1 /TAXON_ID=265564 ORGANISM="Thalassiosira punctigera, Strain Tpunct2005C2" /NCGR_SAMPLE_ID=MMETSP1067 /ASSEMBLY_ACC=CAM_ASM_000444 /LENGTH=225 /DNA_ID=CAMNT_0013338065 /DNA_START=41 /DNA_END=715 /DNA_ORIENTATION=+
MMNRLLPTASRSASSSLRGARRAAGVPPSPSMRRLAASRRRLSSDPPAAAAAGGDDDGEFKLGTVKHFRKDYGFIIPDGVDKYKHSNRELCFVHRSDIKRMSIDGGREGESRESPRYFPGLAKNQRVRFKVAPPDEGKNSMRAYDVTSEDGTPVSPFPPGYLDQYAISQKARFGDLVFDIYERHRDDQGEVEKRIVAAYDNVRSNIERQAQNVQRVEKLTRTNSM